MSATATSDLYRTDSAPLRRLAEWAGKFPEQKPK